MTANDNTTQDFTYSRNATAEENARFDAMKPSMTQGFGGTFDQLEQYLAKL